MKFTIRKRMALWYTVSIVLTLCAFFGFAVLSLTPAIIQNIRRLIEAQSTRIASGLRYRDGGSLVLAEKRDIRNDVYYSVYDMKGTILLENHELDWLDSLHNPAGEVQQLVRGEESWIVLDRLNTVEGLGPVRLRLTMPVTSAKEAAMQLLRLFILILPLGGVIAIISGLLSAKNSLAPVDRITNTAREISRGDLSKRLNFPESADEVGRLAATFDTMLASLEEAFKREQQFTSDVSHELRTPLAVMLAHADEAIHTHNATREQYREALDEIYAKARDMQVMISQMLTLARMFEGSRSIEMTDLDLGEILEDIAGEIRPKADERHITIEVDAAPPLPIRGDLMLITRLLIILTDNAIQYGKDGGRIILSARREKNRTILTVEDNGQGIDEADLPRIFDRFYRADTARSSGKNSGLGLTLAEQIVKLHGGTIGAESTKSEGSIFRIVFL